MATSKFIGTGVAIVTPFRKDSSIDFKALEKITNYLIDGKAEYIVSLGTTGESVSLSKDEKHAIVECMKETINGRVPLVVGIGGNCTQSVVSHIKVADLEGVDAILTVSPYYNKPSQEGIYLHYKAVASASSKPVIMYNVPGRTSSNMSWETTIRLATDCKNIIAIKEASGNLTQITHILKNKPKDFLVISGDDALTLPMIALGGVGVISVIANAYPLEFSEMVRTALKGDYENAQKQHYSLIEMIDGLFEEGSPSGIKACLEIMGLCGNHLRLPLVPISEKLYKKLEKLDQKLRK
jgi:4-hydroxy-tetrahydrodipicolinate synthase